MSSKLCSGSCGRKLEVNSTNFQRDRRRVDGFRARCKRCSSAVASSKWPSVEAFDKEDNALNVISRSTLRDGNGEVIREWTKVARDKGDEYQAMLEACRHIADEWPAKAKATKAPKYLNDDLLACYTIGDAHVGMLAWPAETDNKFDLEIAERNLVEATDKLVSLAPAAKHALIVNLGDFTHSDNFKGETTQGTRLDVDGRWPKVLQVAIRTLRRMIDRALEKHEHVTVICAVGNHDTNTSIMLAICLAQFYEKEPRVTINTSPQAFHYYRFGKVLIGVTHGDKVKKQDLGPIMATDRAQDWGETTHRFWLLGHVHHDVVKEMIGVTLESFRTLAGKDAWHHGQGYRAGRDMKMDVYHKEYGRINRHIVGIDQLT